MSYTTLSSSLTVEVTDSVAMLRLARAEKRNALDDATVEGLGRFFVHVPAGVGAVVIAGNGPHFCAGLDLGEALGTESLGEAILHSQMWHRAFNEIQFGRVPVVSVLHGAVVGGGLELAAATHLRVAEPSAYYGLPEGQRGIFLGGGGSVRIPRLIGLQRVQGMMFTGRTLSADEGHAAGISQYLVPEGQGLAKGLELARKIATNAPMSNLAIMHALPRTAEGDVATGYFTEALMAGAAQSTPEAKKRLKDFLEKRAAKVTRQ
jgi:(methylthio)acryloyl-CoA hydratase